MPAPLVDALNDQGVVCVVRGCDAERAVVTLVDGTDAPSTVTVRRMRGAPTPGAVERIAAPLGAPAPTGRLVLVCDRVTTGAARRAAELGVSLLAPGPTRPAVQGRLLLGDREVDLGPAALEPDPFVSRVPWVSLHVLRCLVLFGPVPQQQLADLVGATQPRVSQALAALRPKGVPRAELLDRWLAGYPGAGGVATYWAATDSPRDQAVAAVAALRAAGAEDVAVSGDVGADLLAPWARPAHAVVHASSGADLGVAGLVPSVSSRATLTLVVPQDRALLPVARRFRASTQVPDADSLPVADPLQVLHDLSRSPNVDRDQAMSALRRTVLRAPLGTAS